MISNKNNSSLGKEIDLIDIIIIVSQNKLKFFLITGIIIVISIFYSFQLEHEYTVKSEIRPISTFDELEYQTYNLYLEYETEFLSLQPSPDDSIIEIKKELKKQSFSVIDKSYLLNLFIEKIKDGKEIEDAIKKFNFIDKNNYNNDELYEKAVEAAASKISLIPPEITKDGNKKNDNWKLEFDYENKNDFESFIKYIENNINENIRLYLKEVFNKLILNEKNLKKFRLEDNYQKTINAINEYDSETKNKLAFLNEQAQIARELDIDIAKNALESNVLTDTNIISVPQSESPYYMRGYLMIEKEIDLILSRENKENFISELVLLKRKKNNLIYNKDISRLENLFEKTPIMINSSKFSAAHISSSIIQSKKNKLPFSIVILIATLIGALISMTFIFIENAIKFRK